MARLFVAIDLPSVIKERLADLCYGVPGVRWTPIEQMHLTLRFIGETTPSVEDNIRAGLSQIHAVPFTITLKGAGHFPPRRNPKVLWVGVEHSQALAALAHAVEVAVTAAGVEPEHRKFFPHITIARVKEEIPVSRIIPFLQQNALFASEPMPVEEMALYHSQLTRDGAIHTIVERYPLVETDYNAPW